MLFRPLAAASFFVALALPGHALDLSQMTDEERQIFREEVRSYLMDNPQVIMDAVQVLEQRQAAAQAQADLSLVSDNAKDIFDDGFSFVGGNPDGDITLSSSSTTAAGFANAPMVRLPNCWKQMATSA